VKVLLLQDQVYLPSLGGGNKSNRLLLEELASLDHECLAFCPAFTSRAGPTTHADLVFEMKNRGVEIRSSGNSCYRYACNRVSVEALVSLANDAVRTHIRHLIDRFDPDWILVSDDKNRVLLECAIDASPSKTIQIVQTVVHLPFGPLSNRKSNRQATLMGQARKIIVISDFVGKYLKQYGKLDPVIAHLPVYGAGPFPNLGNFTHGYLTMINPCIEKGLDIFLELASRFPQFQFAAVPTWGADDYVISLLNARSNIRVIPPADSVDPIFEQTRVLLVPSVWHETFGYIVVEAMLRGIPVLASNIGGLPEAKLGVDYLLPVIPAVRQNGRFVCPMQDVGPWVHALSELLSDDDVYTRCSTESRAAAQDFLSKTRASSFAKMLLSMENEIR
jgi:glycosyltransferase involved in cell wall biosynthesis